ncbi:cytochrome b N-terminal domain-containing protein [Planctomicrobium sp. SH668]|uniref:cytochrome b N-terminal domain-containing protein n=1 Tax=Planctomicrobium sp. SH668 TaxID=3448126 RepID=UPI003F5CA5E0
MQRLLNWLDDRTGIRHLMKEALFEPIPGGARWRYVWGSTLVFTFMIQVITGTCLWMSYSPSATTAWESVFYIQHYMMFGWIIRGIHHFTAQAMIILLILHMMQIVIDGAYRAPREVNFWLGLVLMQIILFLGLTGYLLPWDQKGYYATQVATEIMGSAPIVGPSIQTLMQGGTQYGNLTLTRFFALHAGILPAMLIGFLGLHIYVFRRHGIHAIKRPTVQDGMFWPDQILKDAVACMAVLIAILAATWYWNGAELTAPANPAEAYNAARPEWYYLFLFKFLKFPWVSQMGEATHLGEAFGAIVVPGIAMTVIFLMPIIAYFRWGHRFNVAYMWTVLGIAGVLTALASYEDWYSPSQDGKDFRSAVANAHRDAARVVELAKSPTGIPPQGAASLLNDDPLTQGPRLFETYCISCHQPQEGWEFAEKPVAPALADPHHRSEMFFGSREWTKSVLTDFAVHFSRLENTQGDLAENAKAILGGSMNDWSVSNGPTLALPENAADLEAITEFVYAQSQRPDALDPDHEKVVRGQEIFTSGTLTNGTIDACADCHSMRPLAIVDGKAQLAETALSEDLFPTLTGYASTGWLKAFISNPQGHYAGSDGNNAMPAFESQMQPRELDLLARWLSQNYYIPAEPAAAH